MSEHEERVVRLTDADEVAATVATRVGELLTELQSQRPAVSLVLTGGSISRKIHSAVAADALDWRAVDLWWGDERFVPADDPERNAGQARADLLDRLPLDPAQVHEMSASDGPYADVASAASAYAHELRRHIEMRGPGEPWFDLLMLGIGPDGHCASLFPGHDEVRSAAYVVPVVDSPKPPPRRISLGMSVLRRAQHVVFVATGEEKADAVARSVAGQDVLATPAAGPRGLETTTWYVDEAAAAHL